MLPDHDVGALVVKSFKNTGVTEFDLQGPVPKALSRLASVQFRINTDMVV